MSVAPTARQGWRFLENVLQSRKILCVVGARPNFMKIAPIMRACSKVPLAEAVLVHTEQHYDQAMNASFFQQLGIPAPDIALGVGSGSHAVQTAEVMKRFEPVLEATRPDCVLVVGDVNSTLACALVAAKKGIAVVHVEAGLRSRDLSMPEEINRLLTDRLSSRLYTTERDAGANLVAEGIAADAIVFVGNVMIDTLLANAANAVPAAHTLAAAGAAWQPGGRYALVTLHRPSNVDDPETLASLVETLGAIGESIPLIFPVHPRTRAALDASGLADKLDQARVLLLPPSGYREMLGLMAGATVVLTDSGGMQEETTALGVPCLTLRENTERPITITQGTNRLVGVDPVAIMRAVREVLEGNAAIKRQPEGWDGRAAERIVDDLMTWLQ